jgi:hypothetical protein
MLSTRGREQGRWAHLVELSYDTLGYLEQNVSPRLAIETFLLEVRREGTPRDLVSRRAEAKEGVARGGAHQVDA